MRPCLKKKDVNCKAGLVVLMPRCRKLRHWCSPPTYILQKSMLIALFCCCGNWGDPDGFWLCECCLYAASAPHHILGVGMRIDIDLLKPINIKSSACTGVSPQAHVTCQAAAVGARTGRVLHFQGRPPRPAHRQPHCTWSEHTGIWTHSAPNQTCSQYF